MKYIHFRHLLSLLKRFALFSRNEPPAWKSAPLSRGANLEPLSIRLQNGIRFFLHPLPVIPLASLAACFPGWENYGLTTFRMNNLCVG